VPALISVGEERARVIAANVAAVRERIAAAARRAGRDPESVRLIAVTKTHPAEVCAAVVAAGVADLGENRVQEGVAKAAALAEGEARPTWHLIGHLQTNKVKAALETFSLIQSVDSEALAAAISRRAASPVDVLLEVNVAAEPSKFGFSPAATAAAHARIAALPHLRVRGLMTVAPQTDDPETVRPVFQALRVLAEQLGLPDLSMGMTDDFEVAVEEGATLVRIGRALFGPRPVSTPTGGEAS
jgi:pyridoxal phosphate enzyme (YggS family)